MATSIADKTAVSKNIPAGKSAQKNSRTAGKLPAARLFFTHKFLLL
jgi:hypothetical protein